MVRLTWIINYLRLTNCIWKSIFLSSGKRHFKWRWVIMSWETSHFSLLWLFIPCPFENRRSSKVNKNLSGTRKFGKKPCEWRNWSVCRRKTWRWRQESCFCSSVSWNQFFFSKTRIDLKRKLKNKKRKIHLPSFFICRLFPLFPGILGIQFSIVCLRFKTFPEPIVLSK